MTWSAHSSAMRELLLGGGGREHLTARVVGDSLAPRVAGAAAGGTQDGRPSRRPRCRRGSGEHPPRGLEDEGGGAATSRVNVRGTGTRFSAKGRRSSKTPRTCSPIMWNDGQRFFTTEQNSLATGDAGAHGDVVARLKPRHAPADCLDDASRVTACRECGASQVDSGIPRRVQMSRWFSAPAF